MIFLKDSNDREDIDNIKDHQEFIEDMSYKIRDPLNAICGIAEIMKKQIAKDIDNEQLVEYIDMLQESSNELKKVVDDCFEAYENQSINEDEEIIIDDNYSTLNNMRIMVAEDSEANTAIVKQMLTSHGAIVTTVANGKEAVELFEKSLFGTYDIILMDVKMPVMDGYEATDRIRHSEHPQGKTIPIIAVTGEVFVEDIHMAMKAGMDAHIGKPYSFDKMYATIKSIIKK